MTVLGTAWRDCAYLYLSEEKRKEENDIVTILSEASHLALDSKKRLKKR